VAVVTAGQYRVTVKVST